MNKHLLKITLNFLAVILLISLIAAPVYFARNFAKVASVKTEAQFLIASQVENFPNLTMNQVGDRYQITFTKQGPSQAYLQVLILNNPTGQTQIYQLENLVGTAIVFFGQDQNNLYTQVPVPSLTSVPISLFSPAQDPTSTQTIEFTVRVI